MGLNVSIDNKKDFESVTEMVQSAVLADIVDKGMCDNKYKPGTKQHKCYFVWIVAEQDSEGRNKRVFESFTVSLNEKATLRKRLKEFGVKFEQGVEVDLESFIGTQRTLVLSIEDPSKPGEKPYLKVNATMKLQGEPVDKGDFIRKKDQTA